MLDYLPLDIVLCDLENSLVYMLRSPLLREELYAHISFGYNIPSHPSSHVHLYVCPSHNLPACALSTFMLTTVVLTTQLFV
ncbi:hypothetical protein FKM82_015973 [Ascaphus truei]